MTIFVSKDLNDIGWDPDQHTSYGHPKPEPYYLYSLRLADYRQGENVRWKSNVRGHEV